MSNTSKVLSNSFWNLSNTIISLTVSFLLTVLIARVLGPYSSGIYSYFIWLIGVLLLVGLMGGNLTVTRFVAEYKAKGKEEEIAYFIKKILKFQLILALSILIFLILLGFKLNFSFINIKDPSIETYFLLAVIGFIPAVISSSLSALLQGLQRYKTLTLINLFIFLVQIPAVLLTLFLFKKIEILLLITVISYSLLSLFYFYSARDFLKAKKDSVLDYKKIFNYGLSIYLITLIDAVIWQRSEIFFLGLFSTSDQIAFYSLSFGVVNAAILLTATSFNSVLLPTFVELKAKKAIASIKTGYFRTTKLLALVISPVSVGIFVLSTPLVNLLFGNEFISMAIVLKILVFSMAAAAIAGSGSALIYSQNKQWFIVKFGIPLAVLNIVLCLSLIPYYGAIGAAVASSITQILAIALGTIYIVLYLKLELPKAAIAKICLSSIFMGVAIYLTYYLKFPIIIHLLVATIFGIIIYLLLILKFKVLDKTDIEMLKSLKIFKDQKFSFLKSFILNLDNYVK